MSKVNLTPAEQTYGKVVYAMAYFGLLIGCIVENKLFNKPAVYKPNLFYRNIDAAIALIPMFPLLAGSYLVSKQQSFGFQLVFRYLIPPILANIYLFGFSEALARKVNSQHWPLIGQKASGGNAKTH